MFCKQALPFTATELALFQQSPIASWIISAEAGEVLAANLAATDFICRSQATDSCFFYQFCRPKDYNRIHNLLQGKAFSENNEIGTFKLLTQQRREQLVTLFAAPFRLNSNSGWLISAVPAAPYQMLPDMENNNEAFYRNLIFEASYGTLLCDAAGTIQFITPAVAAILGFRPQDVVGQNAFSFVHPQDLGLARRSFDLEMAGTPEVKSIVIRLKNSQGNYTWCMVRGHNLLHHAGVEKFAIYFHDDNQRKTAADALKASEERFRTLVRDLQVGVLLLNREGEIQIVNKAMCRLLRLTEAQMLGNCLWDVAPLVIDEEGTVLTKEKRPVYQSLQQKTAILDRVNGYWMPEQNDYLWVLINADPVLDEEGQLQYLLCSFTDITERRRLTEKLLHEKLGRQRLLAQATLDAQERERREIGKELHDNIGQQLNTIKLHLDLAKGAATLDEAKDVVAQVLQQVQGTINEVRQVSRLLVPHSLNDLGLIASVAELCALLMRTSSLRIVFSHQGFCEKAVDQRTRLALFRIVQEQLTNIIRHSGAAMATITLELHERQVSLTISDNGNGFDPQKLRKGLGLNNIQSRAEMLGGSVRLISAPGFGCRLNVLVPV